MGENTALSGMKAIQEFCRSINLPASEASIMSFIVYESFPAKKLGGIWESDKDLIVEWRKNRLTGNGNAVAATVAAVAAEPKPALPAKKQSGKRR